MTITTTFKVFHLLFAVTFLLLLSQFSSGYYVPPVTAAKKISKQYTITAPRSLQQAPNGASSRKLASLQASSDSNDENDGDSSLTPLTSFGAEVVPEGQRPVNEYLDMRRSPLFDWASEEVGTQGVSQFEFLSK